ncbi:MAG TPA: flagellin [Chloroflexota bacterium]|jgi:flagellin
MSLRVNNNIDAMATLNALTKASSSYSQSMNRLSTGKRINSAADDAAGYAISNKLLAQSNGLMQAQSNAQDGISLVQTANGGLQTIQNLLQRYRQLAVQSANDTNTTSDRQALQAEGTQITTEITQIATTTQFNTKNLLDGSLGTQGQLTGATNTLGSTSTLYNGSVYGNGNSPVLNTGTLAANDITGAQIAYTFAVTTLGTVGTVGAQGTASGTVAATSTINQAASFYKAYTGTLSGGAVAPTGVAAGSYSLTITGAAGTATVAVDSSKTFQNVVDAINGVSNKTGVSASFSSTNGITLTNSVAGSAQVASATGQAGLLRGLGLMGADSSTYTSQASLTAAEQTVVTASGAGTDGVGTLQSSGVGAFTHTLSANGNSFTDASTGFNYNLNAVGGLKVGAADFNVINSGSLTLQVGANADQNLTVSVGNMQSSALGVSQVDITTQAGANGAISTIDAAIQTVSNQASNLGAVQNRLTAATGNLAIGQENMTSAYSAITNVNMAQESTNLATAQILQQSATSMLAQANQSSQLVLKLLG